MMDSSAPRHAHILDLPEDVLLYILPCCDLKECLSFSMVCSTFYYMLNRRRSFWIAALKQADASAPIASHAGQDLSLTDITDLKRIVLHTLRLRMNWNLPKPLIIQPIKSAGFHDGRLDLHFPVPGTSLYLTHLPLRGILTCFDVNAGRMMSPEIPFGHKITRTSQVIFEPGVVSIAFFLGTSNSPLSAVIVSIRYKQPEISIKVSSHGSGLSGNLVARGGFLNQEIVGAIRCVCDDSVTIVLEVVAFNRITNKRVTVRTNIPYILTRALLATSFCGKDILLNTLHDDGKAVQHIIPHRLLPYNDNANCQAQSTVEFPLEINATWDNDASGRINDLVASSAGYGVSAVSVLSLDRFVRVRFWTTPTFLGGKAYSYVPQSVSCDISGSLADWVIPGWNPFLIPYSATQIFLAMTVNETTSLCLVRYHPDSATVSHHAIELPANIDIKHIFAMCFDEHCGVLTLVDIRGTLFAIHYA